MSEEGKGDGGGGGGGGGGPSDQMCTPSRAHACIPVSSQLLMSGHLWWRTQHQCPIFKWVMESSTSVATTSHSQTTPQTTPTTIIGHGHLKGLGKKRPDLLLLDERDHRSNNSTQGAVK